MRILLVDDDALLREMYATKFKEAGHTVETVGSGEQAIDMLKERSFDVVLFDMVMPAMTGVELLDQVHHLGLGTPPKCIVLSNQGEEEDVQKAHEAGAAGYIIKASMVPSEVVQKVEVLVST